MSQPTKCPIFTPKMHSHRFYHITFNKLDDDAITADLYWLHKQTTSCTPFDIRGPKAICHGMPRAEDVGRHFRLPMNAATFLANKSLSLTDA